jgi:hypothetical protein
MKKMAMWKLRNLLMLGNETHFHAKPSKREEERFNQEIK